MAIFSAKHHWSAPRTARLKKRDSEGYGFSVRGDAPVIIAGVDVGSIAEVITVVVIHGVLAVISFAAAIGKLTHLCHRQIGKTGKGKNVVKIIAIVVCIRSVSCYCLPKDRAGVSFCNESESINVNNWSCGKNNT